MNVPVCTPEEIRLAWNIMQGVLTGAMQAPDPKTVTMEDPEGKGTLHVKDHPMARVMMAWIEHLPDQERTPFIGSRAIALISMVPLLQKDLPWAFVQLANQQPSMHEVLLDIAASCPLAVTGQTFDTSEFYKLATAEYRVWQLKQG